MSATFSNVKMVQHTIFCQNPWTTNWIRRVWSRGCTNFGTRCISVAGVSSVFIVVVACVNLYLVCSTKCCIFNLLCC